MSVDGIFDGQCAASRPLPGAQFKHAQWRKNLITYVQISCRTQNSGQNKTLGFTGKDLVEMILKYLNDTQFIHRIQWADKIGRDMAIKACVLLLKDGIIESVSSTGRNGGRFTESKRYRVRQQVNVGSDLADMMSNCSLVASDSNISCASGNEDGRESGMSILYYDIFSELFGPVPLEAADDTMSISSCNSSNSESVSSERSIFTFWELHLNDCMNIWREVCLARLLTFIDVPVIEQLLETSEEDTLVMPTRCTSLIRNINLPSFVLAFMELMEDSPSYLSDLAQTDVNDLYPVILIDSVMLNCTTRFSYSPHPSLLNTLLSRIHRVKSQTSSVLPERHADLHNALHNLLLRNNTAATRGTVVEAFQLYNLTLAWSRREYLRKLLKFLSIVSGQNVPALHPGLTNTEFLVNKFQTAIFSCAYVIEIARLELLNFMLANPEAIFGVPPGMKDNVQARIFAAEKISAPDTSVLDEACRLKILSEQNRDSTSHQSLFSLLMLWDKEMEPSKEKEKFMRRFEEWYPSIFQQYFGTGV